MQYYLLTKAKNSDYFIDKKEAMKGIKKEQNSFIMDYMKECED